MAGRGRVKKPIMLMLILNRPRHFSSPSLVAPLREETEKLFTATRAFPEEFQWDLRELWAIVFLPGRALTAHFHCWMQHRWNMMKH